MNRGFTMQEMRRDPVIRKYVIGLILCGVALILDISLTFSPMFWFHVQKERTVTSIHGDPTTSAAKTIKMGLWRTCIIKVHDKDHTKICLRHDDQHYFQMLGLGHQFAKLTGVTQLFQCNGLLFLVAAVITTSLKLLVMRENSFLIPLATVHAFWGAVSFIGSAGVFGTALQNESPSSENLTDYLSFSFIFAVISGAVALAGALVLLIAVKSRCTVEENTSD